MLKRLLAPFKIGFIGDNFDHQNRLTLISNSLALLGIFVLISHAKITIDNGLPSWLLVSYAIEGLIFGGGILTLNYKKQHTLARFLTILGANSIGWRSILIVGKSYNGIFIFFIALALSVIAFKKEDSKFKWSAIGISLLGLPAADLLVYYGVFPIVELDLGVSTLLIDSLLLPTILVIIIHLEKSLSEKFRNELADLNESLEQKVKDRTEQLFKAKEEAESAGILKSQFISNTSHEIRTPMNGIKGYLNLLKMKLSKLNASNADKLKPKFQEYEGQINHSVQRLDELLERLLNLTRLEDGSLNPHPSTFSCKDLIEEELQLSQSVIEKKNLSINLKAENPVECFLDRSLSKIILGNILQNSVRYADSDSSINIELTTRGESIQINISNKGPGVPEAEREKVFEPFTQSSFTDEGTGGTGLGLTFSRRYARLLQGDVSLIDTSPENTSFLISLPLSMPEEKSEKAAA